MGIFDKIKKAVFGEKESDEQEKKVSPDVEKDVTVNEEQVSESKVAEADTPDLLIDESIEEAIEVEEQGTLESENESAKQKNEEKRLVETSVKQQEEQEPKGENQEKQASEEIIEEVVSEELSVHDSSDTETEPTIVSEPEIEEVEKEVKSENQETTEKYDKGLEKSRKTFGQFMNQLFANFRMVDDEFFEDLEEALIAADVGFDVAMRISDELQEEVKLKNVKKQSDVEKVIVEKLVEIYDTEKTKENNAINMQSDGPTIILFVGVNGVGKTTSIGKLAHRYKEEGKKVLLAAADTFRAGAIDQLVVWGERAGVEVVRHAAGSDPAAVVFDAVDKTKKENFDILLVDTAGRLQNKVNLMKELEKMKRVIEREYPSAPHEVLLVVDATTGQNALIQAKQFKETTDVTGLVLSKLDGTAKGGIVLAIRNDLRLPVKLVGLGEGINDLEDFDPNQFVYGLFKDVIERYA
ncbi:signal recognition particle-docking protein FtsY [Vagococcus vulneris]|uniref:Signal recognition particle receptor FtsY n=1 Tax=Vagococcus vulneris TaxID=1977869 RepID=A0A429ZXD6_9ENTE|nr:signal recognition particle-docking protein FtsY [Vagococcus vulneris]RST98549.1 signal recognition particle-docking protein FtsY [Vagococcus vulneris]